MRASRARIRAPCVVVALFGLLTTQAVTARGTVTWEGKSLDEALQELRRRGVPLVYSSSVVRPEMRVEVEPVSRRPLRLLDELLDPHGLEVESGPGGRLLVMPSRKATAPEFGSVAGVVLGAGGEPRPGLIARLSGSDLVAVTGSDGRFVMRAVPVGTFELVLTFGGQAELRQEIVIGSGENVEVVFRLPDVVAPVEEVVVVSRMSLYAERPAAAVSLSAEELRSVPHFGEDLNRAVRVLPGVVANDFEAEFQVRGGLSRETLIRLDGLEIYEPYHLKDLRGVFSIVDPEIVGGVELLPGAFPAEFGDRSSSVLDLRTTVPQTQRSQIGVSLAGVWAGSGGQFDDGAGAWLASARRGYLDLLLGLAGNPSANDEQIGLSYWDVFGKMDYQVSRGSRLGLSLLSADDSLDFVEESPGERVDATTRWHNQYVWLRHQGLLSSRFAVDSSLSVGSVDHDRLAYGRDINEGHPDEIIDLDDYRTVDLLGLRQDWSLDLSSRHFGRAGLELRAFDVNFDYVNFSERPFPIDDPRFEPSAPEIEFADSYRGTHFSLWVSDRVRLGRRGAVEVGLRGDRQSLTDSQQLSPRLNLLWDFGRRGRVRAGWGYFYQSQRPQELEVQFGETRHLMPQRSEHFTVGWENEIGRLGMLRIEAYREQIDQPLRRFETLFDPVEALPEIAIDRIRIDPLEVRSEGLELYLRRHSHYRHQWWAGYIWSRSYDRLPSGRQPRWNDQPHALNLGWIYRMSPKWTVATTWRYHTGWPTTPLSAEGYVEDGESRVTWDVGQFYAERVGDYHSLDLRLARTSLLRMGQLTIFLDVQNLYAQSNERGVQVTNRRWESIGENRWRVEFEPLEWFGILPSFGVVWEF